MSPRRRTNRPTDRPTKRVIESLDTIEKSLYKQGRIHGNPVADGWAGAVIQRPIASLEIFVTDGRTDGRTDRHGKV